MPPRNWLSVNHPATIRQLAIKQPEGGGTVQKYLTVPETAVYLNTSERFVRRLLAERRIAFHHVGRHVRFALSDLDEWLLAGRVEPITTTMVQRHFGQVA
jgi:excisionase family DNA binding protein